MMGDQGRSFGYVEGAAVGQSMNNQIIPRGMISPTGHQPMKSSFMPQQISNQFQHPRTPLVCYGKMPDMPVNAGTPNIRYIEGSSQPRNYFYGSSVGSYNSPNQVNNMRYNAGNFYQHQVYSQQMQQQQQQQQQHYYKQHQQISPILPQNAAFYHDMPQQNVGYVQRMVPERQMSPQSWNNHYRVPPQIMDSPGYGDCGLPKMMPGVERFQPPGRYPVQSGHLNMMMDFKKERYMSPPQGSMAGGFDPRNYGSYGYESPMEKYKMNSVGSKFREDGLYGQQNSSLCTSPQLGGYIPGKRLEHISQTNQHSQMGNFNMGMPNAGYHMDGNIPPGDFDKMNYHNQNPLPCCNAAEAGCYKGGTNNQMDHFKATQRSFSHSSPPTNSLNEGTKKPAETDLEVYHSSSTETCSGSSSPSYIEVDVKYSNSNFSMYTSLPMSSQKTSRFDAMMIKSEPLSSINFLTCQQQPLSTLYQQQATDSNLSLEKTNLASTAGIHLGLVKSSSSLLTNSSLNSSLTLTTGILSQSTKSITSIVKVTPKMNSIHNSVTVKMEPNQTGNEMVAKAVNQKRAKRKKKWLNSEVGFVKSIGTRFVTVPFKWRRIIENKSVYYISPSRVRLESLKEICQYLLTDGTCKCGLLCPLYVDQVFVFDWTVESRYMTAEEAYNSSNNVASLCYHKRKFKQSISLAQGSSCRISHNPESLDKTRKGTDHMLKTLETKKLKGNRVGIGDSQVTYSQRFGDLDSIKTTKKRAYTRMREKRKSKLETTLCDSLKNVSHQQNMISNVSRLATISMSSSNAFNVFQSRVKDSFRSNVVAPESDDSKHLNCSSPYDSDATKSASDVYCTSSSSSDEEDEGGFTAKSQHFTSKPNFIKNPGDKLTLSSKFFTSSMTQDPFFASLPSFRTDSSSTSGFSLAKSLIVPTSSLQSSVAGEFLNNHEKLAGYLNRCMQRPSEASTVGGNIDPSPIKMVENMVSELLITKNSLAEVTTLMMSKAEPDKRKKILLDVEGNNFISTNQITVSKIGMSSIIDKSLVSFGGKSSSTSSASYKMDEAIQQSVSNHLRHLDLLRSMPSTSLTLTNQSSYQSMAPPTASILTNVASLQGISLSQISNSLLSSHSRIFSSSSSSSSTTMPKSIRETLATPLNSIVSGHLVSTPGFFHKSSMDTSIGLIQKISSTNPIPSLHLPPSNQILKPLGSISFPLSNTITEDMFSEDEEDTNSCVVIENWLEEGCLEKGNSSGDTSNGTDSGGNDETGDNHGSGSSVVMVIADDEDLMKTTGTQTSTPASNVSNSTLELVDHDGDSRETICCTNVEQSSNSLDDVTFDSAVSTSSTCVETTKSSPTPTSMSLAPSSVASSSTSVSPADSNINSSGSSSCLSSATASAPTIESYNNSNNNVTPALLQQQQVAQAQVVMMPAQQPFLIPHHQTCGFDAQLYQTSPAGYLQSLGFGFAQGQVGLLHFGQVVNPSSSSSNQSLGLALGLGVNLSGNVVSSNNSRDQNLQQQPQSTQQTSSSIPTNPIMSATSAQSSTQEASVMTTSTTSPSVPIASVDPEPQVATSSVTANQLFQLVVSQGVQPAHHFLVPNYSSFAPFAGAALVPVPMVQQNSMAFCNLVAASGAPTLFTVGQSPFSFVAAAGPAAMQMLTSVNVGEKRQESTSVSAAVSHDAPDSTVDSEEAVAVPCSSSSGSSCSSSSGGTPPVSVMSDVCSVAVVSSDGSSTDSATCPKSVASILSTAVIFRGSDHQKTGNDTSSSDTDNETSLETNLEDNCISQPSLSSEMKDNIKGDGKNECGGVKHNDDEDQKRGKLSDTTNPQKGQHLLGVTKLLKRRNKKLKGYTLLVQSRLSGRSSGGQCRSNTEYGPKKGDHSFSPAFTGESSENTSEAVTGEFSGEKSTTCSSSGDCLVTTTDSTALESAYHTEDSLSKPVTSMKGILGRHLTVGKAKEQTKLAAKKPKPDSPASSDDTIDDADSTTTTTIISSQSLRSFNIGDLVWGPARGFPSWPGKLVSENEVRGNPKPESGKIWVKWFGDNTYAQADLDQLKTLSEGLETHHNARKSHRKGRKMNAGLEAAIQEAMVELDKQMADQQPKANSFSSSERPTKKRRY